MYTEQEDVFYYLTVYNENYLQPALPVGVDEGILHGIYLFKKADESLSGSSTPRIQLFGSGSIMQQVLAAQQILADQEIAADVYSVTSYNLLYRDAVECEAWNLAHPDKKPRVPWITEVLKKSSGKFVAASDFMKVLPASIARWVPGDLICLGTDGYGLSESRPALRDHFGISAEHIVRAAINA